MNKDDILMEALGLTSDQLAGIDPDQAEAELESGGQIPEGIYHAQCVGVSPRENANKTNDGWEFEYELLAGQFKGSRVKDTLWKSEKQKGQNRLTMIGKRLGFLVDSIVNGKKHFDIAPGMTGWQDVRGWAGFIHVIVEEYEMNDKVTGKPTGKKGKSNKLSYDGVLKATDPKVKGVPTGTPATIGNPALRNMATATPPTNGTATPTTSHAPAVDPYAAAGI